MERDVCHVGGCEQENQGTCGAMVSDQEVAAALRTVQEPELRRDLVTLDMVRDPRIQHDTVCLTVVLTTPACPWRTEIKERCAHAVSRPPGVRAVEVNFSVHGRRTPSLAHGQLVPNAKNVVAVGSGRGGGTGSRQG